MYKGREPASSDEEEMVANLFDAMCWVVMTPENKEKFVQAEGIELMLLVIKVCSRSPRASKRELGAGPGGQAARPIARLHPC